ncbi:MAG: FG-GAP repeat protein [Actinobacteria bacterium]|nr:FG-GAP repeat protein [Actinomycetota bacterium]
MVFPSTFDDEVLIAAGRADDGLEEPFDLPSHDDPEQPAVADLDGDGRPDVATVESAGLERFINGR